MGQGYFSKINRGNPSILCFLNLNFKPPTFWPCAGDQSTFEKLIDWDKVYPRRVPALCRTFPGARHSGKRTRMVTTDSSWGRSLKKSAAASSGALLTSLVVTPLDVAKARLQAQVLPTTTGTPTLSSVNCSRLRRAHGFMRNRPTLRTRPICSMNLEKRVLQHATLNCSACLRTMCCVRSMPPPAAPVQLRGTMHALQHIVATEGAGGLWAGLSPTLAIAIPSTVFYYSSYDFLLAHGRETTPHLAFLMPMIAGSVARIAAATIVSPLELIRTRMQAQAYSAAQQQGTMVRAWMQIVRTEGGGKSLFRGLPATLARDVPFSAIYWTCYELMKAHQQEETKERSPFMVAFRSGALAGTVAATLTHPFDVVKTLQQIDATKSTSRTTSAILGDVLRTEGVSGIMTGWAPRVVKIAPACAIMISSYEVGKRYLGLET